MRKIRSVVIAGVVTFFAVIGIGASVALATDTHAGRKDVAPTATHIPAVPITITPTAAHGTIVCFTAQNLCATYPGIAPENVTISGY